MPLKDTAHDVRAYKVLRDVGSIHSLGLVAVIILGVLILFVPRRYVIIMMLIMVCFVSVAQKIVVVGLDFQLFRILLLIAFLRILIRSEWRGYQWKPLDVFFISWALSNAIMHIILMGSIARTINRTGFLFDAVGFYLVFRILLQSMDEMRALISGIILISIPVAFFFILERMTGHNLFAIFGGVPAITWVRAGVRRCQGAFSHPILAGSFWASLIPWMTSRYKFGDQGKFLATIGVSCGFIIVLACGSSTPLLGLIAGAGIFLLYPVRKHLRFFFISGTSLIAFVSLILWTPPWNIISVLGLTPGATGAHRVRVINAMLINIDEWWMFGLRPGVAATWGRMLNDVTNEYLVEAARGGLLTMVMFIIMLFVAFNGLRKFIDITYKSPSSQAIAWGLTISLSINCIIFMGVSYFGQIRIMWYLLLAAIASLTPSKGTVLGLETEKELKVEDNFDSNNPWVTSSSHDQSESTPWLTPKEETVWQTPNEDPIWRVK